MKLDTLLLLLYHNIEIVLRIVIMFLQKNISIVLSNVL